MKKILNITKKQVFDGDEKEFNNPINFSIKDIEFSIKVSNFINNPLKDASKLPRINFKDLLTDEGIQLKEGVIKSYINKDGLKLYYIMEQNTFIILSFGEWQQNRYIINIESVWEVN